MVWFDGHDLHDPSEKNFVEALTLAADDGAFPGLSPSDTASEPFSAPIGQGLSVSLVVPKVTCERRWLWVTYVPGHDHGTPVLQSEWSSNARLDLVEPDAYDGPGTDSELWVSGVAASPATCAGWASAWFDRQLQRPVTRREWDQPAAGPGASLFRRARVSAVVEWSLGEPEEYLADHHGMFGRWRLTRQPPSREIRERP